MEIVMKNVGDLRPYDKNPKKHSKDQVRKVADSIRQYGFVQPLVIDSDGTIVIGHCRWLAAKQAGLHEIPCVMTENLDAQQIKALRLVDNKLNESDWDLDFLQGELVDIDLDLECFGFFLDEVEDERLEQEERHAEAAEKTQDRVSGILNLGLGQYPAENKYDIPEIAPVYDLPEIREWIGFNYVLSDDDPEGKAVHFFLDDYQFERLWNNPEKYLDRLQRYACVASPDFSPYGDMPMILQLYNHYRKHWVAAWLQERGVTVIPTIRCSTDPRSLDWYLDGEPRGGIVLMSTMWSSTTEGRDISAQEYARMKETLHPKKIFLYGGPGRVGVAEDDNVEYIDNFTRGRFGK